MSLRFPALQWWGSVPLLIAFTLPAFAEDFCFGERAPGLVPRPFAPKILSVGRPPHSRLTFSVDGSHICWSALLTNDCEDTVLCAHFDGSLLGKPSGAPFPTGRHAAGPSFSDDGLMVFFKTSRNIYGPREISGIAAVRREAHGWSHPLIIASTFDSTRTAGQPTIARSGNIYFSGRHYNDRFPKIYRVEFSEGEYLEPVPLPPIINRP